MVQNIIAHLFILQIFCYNIIDKISDEDGVDKQVQFIKHIYYQINSGKLLPVFN